MAHTNPDEIKGLIQEHQALIDDLKKLERGPIPEPHPYLYVDGKLVFIDPKTMTKLPPAAQARLAKQEAKRNEGLAVELPLHPAYWPEPGQRPTEAQASMVEWRSRLQQTMRRLREYALMNDSGQILPLFPLAEWVSFNPSFHPMTRDQIIGTLGHHVELLMKELKRTDSKEHLLFRLWQDVPAVLREARRLRKHSQAKAAECMDKLSAGKVSEDAVKSWETMRRQPRTESRTAVERYVLEAFAFDKPSKGNSVK